MLNTRGVDYLVVGGYAVGYYGYPRTTADLVIWIAISPQNAAKIVDVLREFGFGVETLAADLFLKNDQVIRLGTPPLRIEILTTISGVSFPECYAHRHQDVLDGVEVPLISLPDLKANKSASGRPKDLDDLQNLG